MFRKSRVFSGFLGMAVMLSACTSNSYQAFLNPGVSTDRASRDRAECDVEANRLFPAANWPNTYPYGTVGYWGGGWGGTIGVVHTTDVNSGMRHQHLTQCMRLKGYAPHVFQKCTADQMAGKSYAPLTRSPAPSSDTICAIDLAGGGWTLIDLAKPLPH